MKINYTWQKSYSLEKGGETNPYYTYENIRNEWYNYKKTQDVKEY